MLTVEELESVVMEAIQEAPDGIVIYVEEKAIYNKMRKKSVNERRR